MLHKDGGGWGGGGARAVLEYTSILFVKLELTALFPHQFAQLNEAQFSRGLLRTSAFLLVLIYQILLKKFQNIPKFLK